MLYRFREAMLVEAGLKRHPKDKTPLLPGTTTSIPIAEQARRDVLKQINRKIARVQDPDAELPVLRTINDEINDFIGQVRAWDERIRELGGLSRRSQRRIEEFETASAAGEQGESVQIDGKFYFGRAKELPEVLDFLSRREAVNKEAAETRELKAQRLKMYEQVNHEYYGKLPAEELAAIDAELQEFAMKSSVESGVLKDWVTGLPVAGRLSFVGPPSVEEALEIETMLASVPKQAEVESFLLERRKQELLKRYTQ